MSYLLRDVSKHLLRGRMKELTKRQKEIIQVSIELISEKSIQGLTIKNLAGKLSITEGAIYRHFKSKFDILFTILTFFKNESRERMKLINLNDSSAMSRIEAIFTHHFKYFTEKPAVTSVIFSESIFQNDSRLSDEVFNLLRMHEEVLEKMITFGQENGEFRKDISYNEIVPLIIGSIRYTVTKWRLSNFKFDLIKEGDILLNSIKIMIKK